MVQSGYRIWLCPEVQVTHLKKWTLSSWLRSDIQDRAIPWTRLILSSSHLPSELNLDLKGRVSAVIAWLSVGFFFAGLRAPTAWIVTFLGLALLTSLNVDLYRLFYRKGGILFALCSYCLHMIYYLYSSLTFLTLFVWYRLMRTAGERLKPFTGLKRISE
jgi:hypothetical protein